MRGCWKALERSGLIGPALVLFAISLLGLATPASAQNEGVEAVTKRARNGAGLRFGIWNVRGLVDPQGGTASESPAFEGYFEKGLDLHLAWENTVGFWRRTQTYTDPGLLANTDYQVESYLLPSFTALKLYPFTRPSDPIQPYLNAGVGFTLGIDRVKASSTDPGIPDSEDMTFQTGLGLKAGLGVDWRLGQAFGLGVGGRYQWTEFGGDVGGQRIYNGLGADLGLTYRFQYQ
jgi:opacity protein-like surface antigen